MIPSTKQFENLVGSQDMKRSPILPMKTIFLTIVLSVVNGVDVDLADADIDVEFDDFPFERQTRVGMRWDKR